MQPLTIFQKTEKDNLIWKPEISFTYNSLKLSPFNRLCSPYGYRDPNTCRTNLGHTVYNFL